MRKAGLKLAAPMTEAVARGGAHDVHRRMVGQPDRPRGRLVHDSTRGPARNPERRRCPQCWRRLKHCRCG